MTMTFSLTLCRVLVSHHEVDGGVGSGIGLHQGASWLPGAEHEAHEPGDSDSNVRLAPGDQRLAVKELGRRHHWTSREEE